jgi:5'(3')-deoxyribonucleotidase
LQIIFKENRGKIMRVYCDLDGVLCNWTKGVCDLFSIDYREPDVYDITKMLGVPQKQMWEKIDEKGHLFWSNLENYPWFDELIERLKVIDKNFCILTSPSKCPNCVKGKLQWIQKKFGNHFRNYIFAPAKLKKELAGPNKILIDDKLENILDWNNNGGHGILFPQPYNVPYHLLPDSKNIVNYILKHIS